MNNYEKAFEDAIISRIASEYVHRKGLSLEEEINSINQNLTQTQLPNKRIQKMLNKNITTFLKKNKKYSNGLINFYKCTSIFAALLLLFNISIVSVPAARSSIVNFLIQFDHNSANIIPTESTRDGDINYYKNSSESDYDSVFDKEYSITYLPKGYKLDSSIKSSNYITKSYTNKDSQSISFSQEVDVSNIHLDANENSLSYIDVSGYNAAISEKDNKIIISWKIDKYYILMTFEGTSRDEAIHVAQSVK